MDGEEENILRQSLVPLCGGLLFIFIVLFAVNTLSKNGIFGRHNKHFFSKYLAEEVGIISENGYVQHTLEWVEDEIENDLDKWRDILHMENSGGMNSGAAVAADEDLRAAGGTSASSPSAVGHHDDGAVIPYKSTSDESPKHLSDHPHPKETNLMKLPIISCVKASPLHRQDGKSATQIQKLCAASMTNLDRDHLDLVQSSSCLAGCTIRITS